MNTFRQQKHASTRARMYLNGSKYINMHTQELIGNIRGRKECNPNNNRKKNEYYITKHSSSQY